ncbi:MAG: SDR family oxidoreductase [Shewanella sp.]|nr:SDR family oxidoreductase [Shewanella sp.]MCF1430798.1 SDR family oxidoreductase [Shewanella sp.]MCF1437387.1 SDR family oxidoreductase [Shewanella sp.]MCF1458577.1 SDR family oxidoreductase [Shewanella sp.]
MANLKNKVVVITGASEGIGRALAREMAPLGCHLVLCARNQARLQSLVEEITALGGMASSFAMDITDKQSCTDLVTLCEVELGRLDIVIYNAGISMWSRFDQLADMDVMERLIRVNYLAPVQLTILALPALKASKGQLVVVSSLAGLTGVPERSGYCASKHAVTGFFDSLRIELAADQVSVTQIYPDFVLSEIHKRALDAQGNPLGNSPMQQDKLMTAQQCAQLMVPAILSRQRDLLTSTRGKLGKWLKILWPSMLDRIAIKAIEQRK